MHVIRIEPVETITATISLKYAQDPEAGTVAVERDEKAMSVLMNSHQ